MTYTAATYFYDYEHQNIQSLVSEFKNGELNDKEKAIQVYLKVRDGWRYQASNVFFKKESYKASDIAPREKAHCIDKSILLIACLRALNIPARIHLAKVKNHIAAEDMIKKLGTDELTPHGMVNIYLNEKWVKVSPAFNAELCEKCNVEPLGFDGENDSIFQEFNKEGSVFMEYLEDYGHFEDLPMDFIFQNMKDHYYEHFAEKYGIKA